MVDKYSIIVWLQKQWGLYKKYWKHERLNAKVEKKVGRIALQSIQALIKIKHLQKHNDTFANCFVMDGNADNGIELDDVVLDKEDQHLVRTAFKLLEYGG